MVFGSKTSRSNVQDRSRAKYVFFYLPRRRFQVYSLDVDVVSSASYWRFCWYIIALTYRILLNSDLFTALPVEPFGIVSNLYINFDSPVMVASTNRKEMKVDIESSGEQSHLRTTTKLRICHLHNMNIIRKIHYRVFNGRTFFQKPRVCSIFLL